MSFSSYSLTPANNLTLAGLSLAENGTSLASINNQLRQLMSDGKELSDTVAAQASPTTLGAITFTGQPTRSGKGAFLAWNSTGQTSGLLYIQASGGSAPGGMQNGDFLFEY